MLGHGSSIVRDGLVLHLDAANVKSYPGSGTVWNDLSGLGNDGTLVNGVGYDSGSLVFDGTNDYCSLQSMANYNFGSNFTVLVWHKNIGGDYRGVVANTYGGAGFDMRYGRENYYGGANNGTILNCYLNTLSGTFSSSIFSDLNKYGQYAYTYNGSNLVTYKNGNLWSLIAATGTISVSTNPIIIGRNLGSKEYLSGYLPTVQIYNRSLSAAEVQQNFEATRGRYGI